jgi:16S rRNA (cytosine967-C5)-methyltransferase
MPVSPSRKVAYQILLRLEAGRATVIDQLQIAEVSNLEDSDRRLTMEIVMGVLRWKGELDYQIGLLSKRKVTTLDTEILAILRMGAYQIRFLERIPKHAAVDESVELAKAAQMGSASGFVNAVLRKCAPPKERWVGGKFEDLSAEMKESVHRSYPLWILKRWERLANPKGESGEATALRLAYAGLTPPSTTLRVVDSTKSVAEIRLELEAEGVTVSECLFAKERGLKVLSGPVQNSVTYREGRVVIQDEASQLVAELVSPESGQRVLDLCAAPGMKTGQIAQMLGVGTMVVCDRSAARLKTMGTLLPRSVPASVRVEVVRLDASKPLPFAQKFDRILLDAACSGTGTLARNPDIKWRLTPNDITRLSVLQGFMLRNALPLLADRGRLVYSTCSLEPEENSEVVERVLKELPEFRSLSSQELAQQFRKLASFFDLRGYFGTRPDQNGMDGFNAAVIVRKGYSFSSSGAAAAG